MKMFLYFHWCSARGNVDVELLNNSYSFKVNFIDDFPRIGY